MGDTRLMRDPRGSLFILLLTGFLVFGLQSGALAGLSYVAIGAVLFPFLLLIAAAVGGILPALLCFLLVTLGAWRVFGVSGLWYAAYMLPPLAVFTACHILRVPFYRTALYVAASSVFSIAALFAAFRLGIGGSLYGYIADSAVAALEDMPERDSILYTLWRGGFLSFDAADPNDALVLVNGGYTFIPEALGEFLKQVRARVEVLTASFVPGLLTTFSVNLGLLGTGLAVTLGKRRGAEEDLGMPPFSAWHIPRAWGRRLWVLAAGYLLAAFSRNPVLGLAGQMMYNVFFALFAIQGLASLDFRLKARGWRFGTRLALLALLQVLLSPAALVLGLMDQLADPRNLRKTPADGGRA
ncbi:MAG TPA: DUF2232 domain-containing protein [Candidatus Limnocylindria bacterium]|nr:DUF2232 domain-containing protein [Candidatus Limnocylindria bacterium]